MELICVRCDKPFTAVAGTVPFYCPTCIAEMHERASATPAERVKIARRVAATAKSNAAAQAARKGKKRRAGKDVGITIGSPARAPEISAQT